MAWVVLAARGPGVAVSRCVVVAFGRCRVLYGHGVPELYLHDDVGQQVSHSLHTVFTIIDAFVGNPDGSA